MEAFKTPPYSKLMLLSTPDTVFIYMGGSAAWSRAKDEYQRGTKRGLVFPEGQSPFKFSWPVLNRDNIVIDYGEADEVKYQELGLALLQHGSTGVIVIHEPTNNAYRYRKSGGCL